MAIVFDFLIPFIVLFVLVRFVLVPMLSRASDRRIQQIKREQEELFTQIAAEHDAQFAEELRKQLNSLKKESESYGVSAPVEAVPDSGTVDQSREAH